MVRLFFPALRLHLPRWDLITVLVLAIVIVQVWFAGMAGDNGEVSERSAPFYLALGLSWEGVSGWKLWQFLTHGLVHGSWFHAMVNVLMLWLVGGRVIQMLGQKFFGVVVLSGVLAGGVLHVLVDFVMMRGGYPVTPLVGISGACLALLLVLTTVSPDSRMWPVPVSGKNLGLGLIFAELLLLLMTPELGVPGLSMLGEYLAEHGGAGIFRISHACHLGGALAGWYLARRVLAVPSLEDLRRARRRQEIEG